MQRFKNILMVAAALCVFQPAFAHECAPLLISAKNLEGGGDSKLSPDGKTLAVAKLGQGYYTLFDVATGNVLGKVHGQSLQLSNKRDQVLVSSYAAKKIVDVKTGAAIHTFYESGRATLTQNGESVWFVNGQSVIERDTATGAVKFSQWLPRGANRHSTGTGVLANADGNVVAIGFQLQDNPPADRDRMLLLNRENGKSIVFVLAPSKSAKFSADGNLIVTADGMPLVIYDTVTMKKIFESQP